MGDSSDIVASKIEAKRRKLEQQAVRRRGGDGSDPSASASSSSMERTAESLFSQTARPATEAPFR